MRTKTTNIVKWRCFLLNGRCGFSPRPMELSYVDCCEKKKLFTHHRLNIRNSRVRYSTRIKYSITTFYFFKSIISLVRVYIPGTGSNVFIIIIGCKINYLYQCLFIFDVWITLLTLLSIYTHPQYQWQIMMVSYIQYSSISYIPVRYISIYLEECLTFFFFNLLVQPMYIIHFHIFWP